MAILFMGGEEIDFTPFGTVGTSTASGSFRSDFARCSLRICGGPSLGNRAYGAFTRGSSGFWISARISTPTQGLIAAPGLPLIALYRGQDAILAITMDDDRVYHLGVWEDQATFTVLASATSSQPVGLHKIDLQVEYGSPGVARLYVNQVLVIEYTGNGMQVGSGVELDGFALASPAADSSETYWSEVISAERDTRTMMLKTHAPVTTAADSEWTGTHSDIDDIGINETDGITSNTADQVAMFGVSDLLNGNLAIRGFKVSGYAARGEVGPTHIELGIRTDSTMAFSAPFALDTGWSRVGHIFEINPVTNAAWTVADINDIEIGVRSKN